MISSQVYQAQGLRGLSRGFMMTFWRDSPAYGGYFCTYEGVKYALSPDGDASLPVQLVAGGCAGIATWLMTYPADVIKSVQQSAPDNTPRRELRYGTAARPAPLPCAYFAD